jgi:hypothetical protein
MKLHTDQIYHIRVRTDGAPDKVLRAVYQGAAGVGVHWFVDADAPEGGHFFLRESEFVVLGEQQELHPSEALSERVVRCARTAARASAARQTAGVSATDVATDVLGALFREGFLNEPTDLTAPGDALQSAASRLAAGVRRIGADRALGYEDSMALREVESAVADWTEARR